MLKALKKLKGGDMEEAIEAVESAPVEEEVGGRRRRSRKTRRGRKSRRGLFY